MLTSTEELLSRYEAGVRDFSEEDLSGLRLQRRGSRIESLVGCNFTDCMFSDCVFGAADFSSSCFDGAEFELCNGSEAKFIDCTFRRAHLMESAFIGADFFRSTFVDAHLSSVDFGEAFFGNVQLDMTKVIGCQFEQAVFGFGAISRSIFGACNMDEVTVVAPCDIDAETVSLTLRLAPTSIREGMTERGGPIVDAATGLLRARTLSVARFFVSAGVEREMVRQYSGTDDWSSSIPAKYGSVFISYSSVDHDFATSLHQYLSAQGVGVWFAPHDIRGGRRIEDQLSAAITEHSKLVLVLSESSMQSNWVATELLMALDLERQTGSQKLYPIRVVPFDTVRDWRLFDSDHGKDLAKVVREYYIPDFTEWRNGVQFGIAANRLLQDLQD
jgi:hypothetical protein